MWRVANSENSIFRNRPFHRNEQLGDEYHRFHRRFTGRSLRMERRMCTLYLKRCFVTAGLWAVPMRTRGKERERRGGVSATARIINNKGIGMGEIDGCTMTDVPSITSSLSSRRIDRAPTSPFSRLLAFLSSLPFLRPSLLETRRPPASLLSRSFLLLGLSLRPARSEKETTYSDLDFSPV